MPLEIPPELKKITSYIRRAEELDKDTAHPESRVVAYYCRQHAVQQGIPLASSSQAAKTCLTNILNDLEAEKQAMNAFTKAEAAFLCRTFAYKVFDKADASERQGTHGAAVKQTARAFYVATSFLEILKQFATDDSADEQEQKAAAEDRRRVVYAKWKATQLINAHREGRTPTPGGYGQEEPDFGSDDGDDEDEQQQQPNEPNEPPLSLPADAPVVQVAPVKDDNADQEMLLPPPPAPTAALLPPPAMPPPPQEQDKPEQEEEGTEVGLQGVEPPPAYTTATTGRSRPPPSALDLPPAPAPMVPPPAPMVPPPAPVPPPDTNRGWFANRGSNNNNNKLTKTQWADVTELTRFALAAVEEKNADLAAERLTAALQTLGRR